MDTTRILTLKASPFSGEAVVYVMSRDQRTYDNHALLAAQQQALEENVPLYVFFNLKHVPNRAREHYEFMLTSLEETAATLRKNNIAFVLRSGNGLQTIGNFLHEVHAGSVYFDFSPLNASRELAKKVAAQFDGATYVVDTHNIIPAWVASDKQEFAAHTMRRKVHKLLENYLVEPGLIKKHPHDAPQAESMSFKDAHEFIKKIAKKDIQLSSRAGEAAATEHLTNFIEDSLATYAVQRNDSAHDQQSGLSPYLHFGQLSSLRVALEVLKKVDQRPLLFDEARMAAAGESPSIRDGMNALFEEMIVRKELSDNFCFYNKDYTSLKAGPRWGQDTLESHRSDIRDFVYTRKQWEAAQTHDEAWNAAQNQLLKTGKIHGYMRMYWAKKMLEWSETPEAALADCVYLNDAYSIDGGDPNGYVGILWSMVGLHDRPWSERSVFGKVRYMNAAGLKRKFDIGLYQQTWNSESKDAKK